MRILSEDVRQAVDTLIATAIAVHASHHTRDDWRHCTNPHCIRVNRVATRLEATMAVRKRTNRYDRRMSVRQRLEGMIG